MSRVAEIPRHQPMAMDGHYQRRERAAELISSPSSKSLLSSQNGQMVSSAADGRTNHIYSPSLSSDDDADNDEVVITAAAARSEPILTPGRSERGAPYTKLFHVRNIRLS